jgi:phosphocarrier protein FPr/phosphocarrier protein
MSDIVLLAPLSGWATPLEEVDDEAFAARMLGDGVAIDPTEGSLRAPCDGEVTALPASAHAISLRADGGADLLLHVGIDTVTLNGAGFSAMVREGQRVRAGDLLLRFDLERIARGARSAVTPVLVTEPERFRIVRRRSSELLRAGDELMTLGADSATGAVPAAAGDTITASLRLPLAHGLHARPAAVLAQAMRPLRAEATLSLRGRTANVRSTVSLLSLGARKDDVLRLEATGPQASLVRGELERALTRAVSMGDPAAAAMPTRKAAAKATGISIASPGIAAGPLVNVTRRIDEVDRQGAGPGVERKRLDEARAGLASRLRRRAIATGGSAADILGAHLEFIDDPELLEAAYRHVAAGASAGFAWRSATGEALRALESVDDARLRARIDDLRDVEAQLLDALAGGAGGGTRPLPAGAIVVAHDLLPSQFMALDTSQLGAVCTVSTATTSHVAILAGALGLPMLTGVDPSLLALPDGTPVGVDAERGVVVVEPAAAELEELRSRMSERAARTARLTAAAALECRTADGQRIHVRANVGSLAEARAAVAAGAEGCGLLRTEFLFLDRSEPPDAGEQRAHYQEIADAMAGRPLVVRTLDAGGDKPIPFLAMPPEDNPALGLRGIRVGLWRPDILRAQLEAILSVRSPGGCRILLPMVNDAAEIEAVRALAREVAPAPHDGPGAAIGIMVETPAAALNAATLAMHADFLSIGTNDLTQYVLAIDRTHPTLSHTLDALHPVVLGLIDSVCRAARAAGRPVAVCGGLASEPSAAPLLVGLGVEELSAVPAAVPAIKEAVRRRSFAECQTLARTALDARDAAAVRAVLSCDDAGGGR